MIFTCPDEGCGIPQSSVFLLLLTQNVTLECLHRGCTWTVICLEAFVMDTLSCPLSLRSDGGSQVMMDILMESPVIFFVVVKVLGDY